MSDKTEGFQGLTIAQVQQKFFLRRLPACRGRWEYRSSGLKAPPGTVVLFQFQARIIAMAIFRRDEKFEQPVKSSAGVLHFDPASIRTFEPLDFAAMQRIWPAMRRFGHIKQRLNPALFPKFRKRLKRVATTVLR